MPADVHLARDPHLRTLEFRPQVPHRAEASGEPDGEPVLLPGRAVRPRAAQRRQHVRGGVRRNRGSGHNEFLVYLRGRQERC